MMKHSGLIDLNTHTQKSVQIIGTTLKGIRKGDPVSIQLIFELIILLTGSALTILVIN